MKKKLKLKFTDFYSFKSHDFLFFKKLLETEYELIDSDKPDYIFYSMFGNEYLNYDCVKIFFTGENVRPNFNICDYAIGFDWMTFEDRYYRLPLYVTWPTFDQLKLNTILTNDEYSKRKFCNFIYSNASASPVRGDFFDLLNKYKFVESSGKYKNNTGHLVSNKIEYMKNFKFSIAFENASTSGYTTEKIVDAKVAGTIPIYWGNPNVTKEFNNKAFINCHEFESFTHVVDFIKFVDNDDALYLKIMNEPLFVNNIIPEYMSDKKIIAFFDNIFKCNPISAKKRCGLMHEKLVERDLRTFIEIRSNPVKYFLYIVRKLKEKYLSSNFKVTKYKPKIFH